MFAALALAGSLLDLNALTAEEKKAGWTLLFDGKSIDQWEAYGGGKPGSGWTMTDGVLSISDPGTAGDIVTKKKYRWFELFIDVKLEPGQNSGIMFHIGDGGGATWHTGPEIQIYDHQGASWAQQTGWLYDLYRSEKDATKPIGEWNTFRILVSREKCLTEVNGVLYYEYKLGTPDYLARVSKSKFKDYKGFGVLGEGRIGIQGDHGKIHFRNIKIRPIPGS